MSDQSDPAVQTLSITAMSAPSPQEQDLLRIFRSRILDLELHSFGDEDELHDQHLLRWIRARGLDISKAEDMLRLHIKWREANGICPSLQEWIPPPFVTDTYSPKFCGYDNSGSPILLFSFGIWDLRPALARGEKENVLRFKDQSLERIMGLMRLYERQRRYHPHILSSSPGKITQFNCICDWSGFSFRHIMSKEVVDLMLEACGCFEENYPETLKASYNVNCPKIFDVLFKLVKPFLSEHTLSKISIYDSDEAKWKQEILMNLPPDQVPVHYGGTREKIWDLANLNLAALNWDGSFFREIFNEGDHHDHRNGDGNPDFKTVQVPTGDKLAIPITVTSSRTTLNWAIEVTPQPQNSRIDLSIQCDNPESTEREVCLERRKISKDKGKLSCKRAGNYWVILSNQNSTVDLFPGVGPTTVLYKLVMEISPQN